MTAPDGGEYAFDAAETIILPASQAILLHGGRALVLFDGASSAPPRQGRLVQSGDSLTWTSECWRSGEAAEERWCGVALVDALPSGEVELRGDGDPRRWRLRMAASVDIAPQPLADLVGTSGADRHAVFDFLVRNLIVGRPEGTAEAAANQAFARGFFTAAAERDGFIEILARPECGGLVAQGWSLSPPTGPATFASASGALAVLDVEVAQFEREDILPPGRGFCLFAKAWRAEGGADIEAVFFERDGRLLRLDVVSNVVARFQDGAATAHVAHMLPRLTGPEDALRSFRRICRPRFEGEDTLSATTAPIAIGFDAVLQAPDGGLFVMGWLLDPLRRVRLALIKSDQNLYNQMQESWVRLPRPDLCAGFGSDPRFAGLLDPQDALYGFVTHVPAARARAEGAQLYLELVLDDESCLFRPLTVTPFASAERLPQILGAISPTEPELPRIVEEHLTPFLASVPPRPAPLARTAPARPIPLGAAGPARNVAAVMPVRSFAELQPVLGLLAGAPEAQALDLIVVAGRSLAAELLRPLGEAFRFFGLKGALVIASDRDTLAARLDAGVAATTGARVLAWTPSALPKGPGWLRRLIAEADGVGAPCLVSPAMTYEDGSIYFGGAGLPKGGPGLCAVAGYARIWLADGAMTPISAGAAEIALIDRDLLARAGGFAGHLFGDAFAQVDLADRLRRLGAGCWCAGSVEFWMLEDAQLADQGPYTRMMQQIDAGLLARRAQIDTGDRTP